MSAVVASAPDPARQANKDRFEVELEFLQCLAAPNYLYELASKGYLDDPCFINYLDYLAYFRRPEYAQFILYPTALHHLSLLSSSPSFRQALKSFQFIDDMQKQELQSWNTGFGTRWEDEMEDKPTPAAANPTVTAPTTQV